jgi:ABC-type polysaccharide/polyol phosphate transport system ATPase subunit
LRRCAAPPGELAHCSGRSRLGRSGPAVTLPAIGRRSRSPGARSAKRHDTSCAIVVEHLGKRYDTSGRSPFTPAASIFVSLRDRRKPAVGGSTTDDLGYDEFEDDDDLEDDEPLEEPLHRDDGATGGAAPDEWALRDVSFTAHAGGGLGVLGAAGSGKSSLLRVLAGLSLPTAGRAVVRGVLTPIPSIAASFMRPDHSARQNVITAGRLFGLPRSLISKQLPDVLAFAELAGHERPTTRGAGDLFRRIGMSAALNLDPDVVLIDELPRVSDEEYQERWLELVRTRIGEGVTVLLASRSHGAIRSVCTQTLWLHDGAIVDSGDVDRVAQAYDLHVAAAAPPGPEPVRMAYQHTGVHRWAALLSAEPLSVRGAPLDAIDSGDELTVRMKVEVVAPRLEIRWAITFSTETGDEVRAEQDERLSYPNAGVYAIHARLPAYALDEGQYIAHIEGVMTGKGQEFVIARTGFTLTVGGATNRDGGPALPGDLIVDQPDRGSVDVVEALWTVDPDPEPRLGP